MDRMDLLLRCDIEEFNEEIERMEIGQLVNMIQCLQTEMTQEQEYFNELSAHLASVGDPESVDGQALSAKMIESQTCLTDLVTRNMKCFMLQSMSQGEGDLAGMVDAEEDKSPGPETAECNGALPQDDEPEFVESCHSGHNGERESNGSDALADISEEGNSPTDKHNCDKYHTSPVSFPWRPASTRMHQDEELHSGTFVFRASHEVDGVGRLNANIEEYESIARSGSVAHRELTHNTSDWDAVASATCVFDSRNIDSQNHVSNRIVMNNVGPQYRNDSSTEVNHQTAITNGYHCDQNDGGEDDTANTRVSFSDLRSRFETEKPRDSMVKRSFCASKVNHIHSAVSTSYLKLQNTHDSGEGANGSIEPVSDPVNQSKPTYVSQGSFESKPTYVSQGSFESKPTYVSQGSFDNSDTFEGEPIKSVNYVKVCSVKDICRAAQHSLLSPDSHTPKTEWGNAELGEGVDPNLSNEPCEVDLHAYTDNTGVSTDSRTDDTGVSTDSRTDDTHVSTYSCTDDTGVSADLHTDDTGIGVEQDIKVSTAKVVLSVSSVSEVDDIDVKPLEGSASDIVLSNRGSSIAKNKDLPYSSPLREAAEGVYEEEGSVEGEGLVEGNVLFMGTDTKKAPPPPISEDHPTNNNVKRHAPAVPVAPAPTTVPVVPATSVAHKELAPTVAASTVTTSKDIMTNDDKIKARVTLKDWEPRKLLEELYGIHLMKDTTPGSTFINMEGYLEKLPLNKKKATLLKTWKRRYFKALNGVLYYFETNALGEKANCYFQLMGGKVEDLGSMILGVDDGRGHYLLVRCPTAKEFVNWKKSLESQTNCNIGISYVKPVLVAPPHKKQIIVIDMGSCSVRAGVLRQQASLPDVFFPTVAAVHKETGVETFGFEALSAKARTEGNLVFPVRPSVRIDQESLAIHLMPGLIRKVFDNLQVDPKQHWVMMSMPANLSDKMKEKLMDIFVKEFQVKGVNMVNQSVLALYSYNTRSGIIVDIGERLEIVPVTDGYIVEGGVTRQPYGGHRVSDALNSCLTQSKYAFFSEVEFYLVRLAMEKLCFVTNDYQETMRKYHINSATFSDSVDVSKFDFPEGSWTNIRTDVGRFQCPEGLFDPELWGMDNDAVQKLVQKAIQASPMDTRREMWRSIYLSGGTTQLPGFIDRLQLELNKFVPSSIVVEVHASPHRYHAAYIGACTLASLDVFQQSCISATQWQREGPASLRKWHTY